MARTKYYTACSLDGFIAGPGDDLSWLVDADHDLPGDDADHWASYSRFIEGIGSLVMGRSTYDWVTEHDHGSLETWGYAQPTWVCTHRDLPLPATGTVTPWAGDVADLHPTLVEAAQGKDVWVVGGGELVGAFLDAGLLDEVHVQYAPVVLGSGAPLLPRRARLRLEQTGPMGDFVATRFTVDRERSV